MIFILVFVLLAILSFFSVHLIRRYTERRHIFDYPNQRSSHTVPRPRGGGLAIVLCVLVAGLLFLSGAGWNRRLIYLAGAAVIAWLGWRDDVHSLSPRVRFLVQGVVAGISIWWLGYFKIVTVPLFGELPLGALGILITFVWILGLTNAYNFMDGIDGMAGGVALSAGIGWMWLASNINNPFVFWIALAITAGSLGFLGHNWAPARIFMGDVGSTFLGYSFAVLPLISSDQGGDALLLGTLLMWIIIMDAGLTFLRRLIRRESIFMPHRTHLYQRLVLAGYKHETVSALYILLTLIAGILAYEWSQGHQLAAPMIFLGLPLIWVLLSVHAARLQSASLETNPVASDR